MVQKQFLITLVHLKMTLNRETINLVPALLSLPASGVRFIVSVHRQLSAAQMLAKMVAVLGGPMSTTPLPLHCPAFPKNVVAISDDK